MATGYELIYDIKEKLGLNTDDSKFSNELILFQIERARGALIKRNYSRNFKVIPESLKQLVELDLELVDDNDYASLDTILCSTVTLPLLIESNILNMSILVDGGSYTDLKFIKVAPERFPYVGLDVAVPNIIYYTIDYDYKLRLKSFYNKYKLLSKARFYGIFMHPEKAWEQHPDYDVSIDFLDTEYPMDAESSFEISNIVMQSLLPLLKVPLDTNNNANEV